MKSVRPLESDSVFVWGYFRICFLTSVERLFSLGAKGQTWKARLVPVEELLFRESDKLGRAADSYGH